MSRYIQGLIEQGEHQQLDFKYQVTDAKKIARSISAFANTEGGRLLIGIKDNGRIAGIKSEEEYFMMESAANVFCKPSVNIKAKTWNIRGKQVLEVIIPKLELRTPITAPDPDGNRQAYVRHEDMNLVADEILHTVWIRKRNHKGAYIQYSENEKNVLDNLKNDKIKSLDELMMGTGLNRNILSDILINFVLADIIILQPTLSGSKFLLNHDFCFENYKKNYPK
ncbi:MAG: AlbA family DNA-binding domain-containing protein [Bacteroidota bacterium]